MAQELTHDVVKEAQSMGALSSIGDSANQKSNAPALSGQPTDFTVPVPAEETLSQNGNQDAGTSDLTVPSRELAKSPFSDKALLAEASGGSDTDTSKQDGKSSGHNRTNSVKKPTTFKSVSVTKNFLAKTAVGAVPITKAGEKVIPGSGTPFQSQALKPRLVAKSALGGLSSRSGLPGGAAGAGPDASKVWNRNRPVPPPMPKTFTDEELKQQYGIHMATRLPADENSKENKWADIDDDEDDWAPEPVQWLDGTKSTVNATENRPPLSPMSEDAKPAAVAEPPVPLAILQPPAKAITTNSKTILKPGNHNLGQSKPGSIVLKASTDKSGTPKATTPAPVPAKSPWAQLPPIDKLSPVPFVSPPVQNASREAASYEAFPVVSPKEIAADDFNRGWDGEAPRNKALFNSQSGLLESVHESNRRAQQSRESGHRQPAVLQRSNNQGGPAEPSAAFQTRNPGMETWQPRHRTGSVGSAGRRMSVGPSKDFDRHDGQTYAQPPQDVAQSQPGSTQSRPWTRNSTVPAPTVQNGEQVEDAATDAPASASPSGPQEDAVVVQQRLMREKIDRARQQKQKQIEEEKREEEARKERLRLKMEALAIPSPTVEQKTLARDVQFGQHVSPQSSKPAQLASPPKPPVPTALGEVAQYGMMKVHQSHPVKKPQVSESPMMNQMGQDTRKMFSGADSTPQRYSSGNRSANANDSNKTPDARKAAPLETGSPDPAGWRQTGLPENISGWASSNISSLWGPPQTKDRALGNGTFDTNSSGFVRLPGQNAGNRSKAGAPSITAPGPIAPPQSGVPQQPQPQSQPHTAQSHSTSFTRHQQQNFAPDHHPVHLPQDPLNRDQSQPDIHGNMSAAVQAHLPQYQATSQQRYSHADWAALPDQIAAKDKAQSTLYMQQYRDTQNGLSKRPNQVVLEETFHRTSAGPLGTPSTVLSVEKRVHAPSYQSDENNLPNGIGHGTPRHGQYSQQAFTGGRQTNLVDNTVRINGEKPITAPAMTPATSQSSNVGQLQRSSRFFPRTAPQASDKSDSPPPPEVSSLDAGNIMPSPVVHLPKIAVVKLPPKSPELTQATPPSSRQSNLGAPPPADWQRKIDNLLRPGKSYEVQGMVNQQKPTVESASAALFDMTTSKIGATVSLPAASKESRTKKPIFVKDKSAAVQSRPIDEDLFPQPEFGSRPTILFPQSQYAHLNQPSPIRSTFNLNYRQFNEQEQSLALSKLIFDASDMLDTPRGGWVSIVVRPLAGATTKTIPIQTRSRSGSQSYGAGLRGRRPTHSVQPNNRGGRKGSGQYSPREGQSEFGRNNNQRGSHRGGRGNGSFARRNITAPTFSATAAQ